MVRFRRHHPECHGSCCGRGASSWQGGGVAGFEHLPKPLTALDCNLRDIVFMQLDVKRLLTFDNVASRNR
jgi:hypothetical protein